MVVNNYLQGSPFLGQVEGVGGMYYVAAAAQVFHIFKIHVRQSVEDILKFTCICVCLCMYLFVCVTSSGQTKKDTELKFGTHTPIDLI